MGIADLFRPKWKHSDASVRADAVRALGRDDEAALVEVARTDEDDAIRGLAIRKLEDPTLLEEIAGSDAAASVRELAAKRASSLWLSQANAARAGDVAVSAIERISDQKALAKLAVDATAADARDAAFARLTEARALAEVARGTKSDAQRREAIGKIDDVDILQSLAIDADGKELGFAALDKLEYRAALELIAKKAKHKAVRARAGKRLAGDGATAAAAAAPDEDKTRHAEQVQLVRTVEDIVATGGWKRASAMDEAREAWKALAPYDGELQSRFDRAVQRFLTERKKYLARIEEQKKAKAEAKQARRQKRAEQEAQETQPAPEPKAEVHRKTIAVPPPAASEPAAEPPEPQRVETAADEVSGAEVETTETAVETTEAVVETTDDAVETPTAPPEPVDPDKNRIELEALCTQLERLVESNSFRKIESHLQKAEKRFAHPGPLPSDTVREELVNRFARVHTVLITRVRELREADEWRRWANVPKQQALVERAEKVLAESEGVGDGALLDTLKTLQNEWKEVGAAPKEKGEELWTKFKGVCDQIYEKAKAQQKERRDEQKHNLDKKRELCERVEALKDSDDFERTAAEIKQLQAEWKKIGPVPRRYAQKIWKRFRGACDHFFERRKPILDQQFEGLQENLQRKQELCERVEALLEAFTPETDWRDTLDAVKRAQGDWKHVGPTPRKEGDAIYKRFRAACDGIFKRRDEMKDAEVREEQERQQRVRGEIEAALGGDAAALIAAWSAVRGIDDRPERGELRGPLEQRVCDALAASMAADPAPFADTDLDPAQTERKRARLLERLEEAVERMQPRAAKPKTAEEMAEQLRNALANNALGGVFVEDNKKDPKKELEAVRTAWRRLGPVPGDAGAAQDARLAELGARIAPPRPHKPKPRKQPEQPEQPEQPKPTNGASAEAVEAAPEPTPEPAPEPAPEQPAAPTTDEPVDEGWD